MANSAYDSAEELHFHIRILPDGAMSRTLISEVAPEIHLQGPFGNCTYQAKSKEQALVFIGSGTGLAPLYSVITYALSQGHIGPISLYIGSSTAESMYFINELRSLAESHPNFDVTFCCDESTNWASLGSPLSAALTDIRSFAGIQVYTCGHPELVKATKTKTFMAGASMSEIFADSFDLQSS